MSTISVQLLSPSTSEADPFVAQSGVGMIWDLFVDDVDELDPSAQQKCWTTFSTGAASRVVTKAPKISGTGTRSLAKSGSQSAFIDIELLNHVEKKLDSKSTGSFDSVQ